MNDFNFRLLIIKYETLIILFRVVEPLTVDYRVEGLQIYLSLKLRKNLQELYKRKPKLYISISGDCWTLRWHKDNNSQLRQMQSPLAKVCLPQNPSTARFIWSAALTTFPLVIIPTFKVEISINNSQWEMLGKKMGIKQKKERINVSYQLPITVHNWKSAILCLEQ